MVKRRDGKSTVAKRIDTTGLNDKAANATAALGKGEGIGGGAVKEPRSSGASDDEPPPAPAPLARTPSLTVDYAGKVKEEEVVRGEDVKASVVVETSDQLHLIRQLEAKFEAFTKESTKKEVEAQKIVEDLDRLSDRLNLAGLLNVLDGVVDTPGRIIGMFNPVGNLP